MTRTARRPTRRTTRADQRRKRREALVAAGLKAVATHGYAKASVARITDAAGLAQGTFYSYFENHRDFLNGLLPAEGQRYLRHLDAAGARATGFFDRERAEFRASCDFIKQNPYFLRVLTEAESAAPESYALHMRNLEDRYREMLRAAEATGEIRQLGEEAVPVVAEMMVGAFAHIATGFLHRPEPGVRPLGAVPDHAEDAVIRFFRDGLGPATIDPAEAAARPLDPAPPPEPGGTRQQLLDACAEVIAAQGFEGASVAAITEAAGVSLATFYAYFASQQEIFGAVLDHVRKRLFDALRSVTRGTPGFIDREIIGFLGFFRHLERNPAYIRIESEAAVWAPEIYAGHFFRIADSYQAQMSAARGAGDLAACDERELPVLAFILMAARHYLATRYVPMTGPDRRLPDHVWQTYVDVLQHGIGRR